jgi:MYXO-CTERM domain-containing protein
VDGGPGGGSDDDGGCGCSVPGDERDPATPLALLGALGVVIAFRRRQRS